MAKPQEYRAHLPWSAERPQTLVVCCSDGRWHAHVEEFVAHEVSDRADMYAVPGGPATVDPWNSNFDEARVFEQAMNVFVRHHDLHEVWLIAHEGCAYYRARHPHFSDAELRKKQLEDLQRASNLLVERYPSLVTRRVFAGLQENRVIFTTL